VRGRTVQKTKPFARQLLASAKTRVGGLPAIGHKEMSLAGQLASCPLDPFRVDRVIHAGISGPRPLLPRLAGQCHSFSQRVSHEAGALPGLFPTLPGRAVAFRQNHEHFAELSRGFLSRTAARFSGRCRLMRLLDHAPFVLCKAPDGFLLQQSL
jgi:hypothetical protein